MNEHGMTWAAAACFALFLILLAVRIAVSELTSSGPARPRRSLRALELTTVAVAASLVVLLGWDVAMALP